MEATELDEASATAALIGLKLSQTAPFSDKPGGLQAAGDGRGVRRSGCGAASGHGLPCQLIRCRRYGVTTRPLSNRSKHVIFRACCWGYQTVACMIDTVAKPRTKAKPKTERPKLH